MTLVLLRAEAVSVRALGLALSLWALTPGAAGAQPSPPGDRFLPGDRQAVELVRDRRTQDLATVGRMLAYAERATEGAFAFRGYRVERRPGEPFARVRICYRLGDAQPTCGLDYLVTVAPPHVEPAERHDGLMRDFEHGPRAFLRALARQAELDRQPEMMRRLRAALERFNPYDWR